MRLNSKSKQITRTKVSIDVFQIILYSTLTNKIMEKKEKDKTIQFILSGIGIIVFGILIFSNQKLRKENSRLRGENETLTKERMILTEQIKKDWYHIGKIITSKIKIKQ